MAKTRQLLLHSAPFALGIVLSYFFWRSDITLFMIYAGLVLAVIWAGKDQKTETLILIYGIIAGVVVEVIGTKVSRYQNFTNPDAFGIPYWLPVSWGYGFVLMKRIGLIIGKGSPWIGIK